ncbi:hypothetical protein [Streptomyces sp. NPDC001568]|uniref:hypothetical protein n=1 Tax=Streptomyces sp. NPDC001568 TaxID=3364588 RepID=UPI0036888215
MPRRVDHVMKQLLALTALTVAALAGAAPAHADVAPAAGTQGKHSPNDPLHFMAPDAFGQVLAAQGRSGDTDMTRH